MLNCPKKNTTFFSKSLLLTGGLVLFGMQAVSQANELDLRISDDSLHGNYSVSSPESKTHFGMGYFYKNDETSINIANIDLHVKDQTAIANLPASIGLGLQANFFKEEEFKGSAVGIGGSFRVNLPSLPGISLETALHYAPKVLSFGDADEFKRFRFQVNYRLIENADISLGYHFLEAGHEDGGEREFESRAFLGIKLKL